MWGSSREFFVETQINPRGEWREAQSQDQYPVLTKGAGLRPLRPVVWLQIKAHLSLKAAAGSLSGNGASLLGNKLPWAGLSGGWLLFLSL